MFSLKNNYILIEISNKNELRADVGITIQSLGLIGLIGVNVKIDTGCPYTSIPLMTLGLSEDLAKHMKKKDCTDPKVKKEISFGVNDTKKEKQKARQDFKDGNYDSLKQITFIHDGFEIAFGDIVVTQNTVGVSYDRTGNILIGMDILSKLDIHIAKSKIMNKTIMLACPKESLNDDYFKALNEHFGIGDDILTAEVYNG